MNITKEEIDKFLKNSKVGDRGFFKKDEDIEYCIC